MKTVLFAATALVAFSAPALAQNTAATNNAATVGAQVNDIYGEYNAAANNTGINQNSAAVALGGYEAGYPAPGYPGGDYPQDCYENCDKPGEMSYPATGAGYAAPAYPALAAGQNTATVGAQVNSIQGYGNAAVNNADIDQNSLSVAGGSGTSLVNQNATIGAQVNSIYGGGNVAANNAGVTQNGAAVSQ